MRDGVVQLLAERIVHGVALPGTTLPTENDLIRQFGVSRTVIREALKALEATGLVHIQQGRGTVVLGREEWDVLDPVILSFEMEGRESKRLFNDLMEVRLALECQMAEQAALRASDEQLARMGDLLNLTRERTHLPDEYVDLDVLFHEMISQAADNRIIAAVMQGLHAPLRQHRRVSTRFPGSTEMAQRSHEQIFDRLRQRDPAGAHQAMRAHLDNVWQQWRAMASDLDSGDRALTAEAT